MKIIDVVFNQTSQSFSNPCGTDLYAMKEGVGALKKSIPLTAVTESSLRLQVDSQISLHNLNIAKNSFEEEPFFISFYGYFPDVFTSSQDILYDINNELGFKIKDGNISFTVQDSNNTKHSIYYKLPNIGIAYSVIGAYSQKTISLYVDGHQVKSKYLGDSFKFYATSNLSFDTDVSTSYILIDKIEVYKDYLNIGAIDKILSYREMPQNINSVITSDNPIYFSSNRNNKAVANSFIYGRNKDFSTASLSGLKINEYNEVVLDLETGAGTGTLKDSHFLPPLPQSDHNQIYWGYNNSGISVEYSFDDINYYSVLNGSNIPSFSGGMLYYKVTLSTSDIEVDCPIFTGLSFLSYIEKVVSSDNYSALLLTDQNFTIGKTDIPVIYHNIDRGIKTLSGGFRYNSGSCRSVEFMFRPSGLGQTALVDCSDSRYSWSAAGNITKSNISSIFVNGVDVTSKTIVSEVFDINTWYHVFITFNDTKSSDLFFNQSQSGSMIGSNNNYSNIAIYDYDASGKAINHYKYIVGSPSISTASDSINVGSDSFQGFNVDILLLSTQ